MLGGILKTLDDPGFRLLSVPLADGIEDSLGQVMVPLVGYLLEYPVVYTIQGGQDSQRNCLGGRDLIVFEVELHPLPPRAALATRAQPRPTRDRRPDSLLSFSVPAELLAPAGPLPFTSLALRSSLESTYAARLEAARAFAPQLCVWDRVEVVVLEGIVQDRFAL